MTETLEFKCFECKEEISLEVSQEDYNHYTRFGSFIEWSDAYIQFFEGYSWTLDPGVYCQLCKYNMEIEREKDIEL